MASLNEEPPGTPGYMLRKNGYPEGKCPVCGYTGYWALEWNPKEGLDPKLRKCRCRSCGEIYYIAPVIKTNGGRYDITA